MQPTANLFSEDILLRQRFKKGPGGRTILQVISVRGEEFVSSLPAPPQRSADAETAWIQSYLAGHQIKPPAARRTLRAVDLFCGSGGLTTGLKLAGKSLGCEVEIALAVDADLEALEIYRANHGPWLTSGEPVERLVGYHIAGRGDDANWSTWPKLLEPHMAGFLAGIDALVAGPPCQGHSNLNNRTRRSDARNLLYLTTVAFAVASGAKLCIIENVPDVLSDKHEVVRTARALFLKSGYRIDDCVLAADDFGVPQRRRRHFLVAVRNVPYEFDIAALAKQLHLSKPVTVRHAIADLMRVKSDTVFDTVGTLSPENTKRIAWLFKNRKYNLPNRHRPECHKEGHTYPSVYGRMKWTEPAQTITTGFSTPGRGRFIHPAMKRTLTPHEAARLQSFPDSYDFSSPGRAPNRTLLGKVIGDAVPPLLSKAISTVGMSVMLGTEGLDAQGG